MAPEHMDRERVARRLEAGDWVVATGEAARVSHGLGKLSDGDYDPADDALLRARVDFPAGPRWIAAADLERVTPEDELALVERALDRRLVPAPRAGRLRDALRALRAGEREFVRSPGLLDVVWGALEEPPGAPGLVEWFEVGAQELRAVRVPAPAEERRAPRPSAPAARRPAREPRALPPRPRPAPAVRPTSQVERLRPEPGLTREEVLLRVLGDLGLRTLRHLVRALWGRASQGDVAELRALIAAARPPLAQILRHLDERQLRGGLQACGRDTGLGLNLDQLRSALLTLAGEPPPETKTSTPRAAPRLAPDEVLPVVLEHLNRTVLLAVAKTCEAPIDAVDARGLRAAIVAARPPLARVLDSLTTNQLRRAHADCGLQHGGSLDDASLRAELEALAGSGAESTPRGLSDAERAFLETALGTVSLAGLFRIARGMGIDWASRGRGPPARAILDGAPTPGSIVARLEPDELGAACRACGLEPPHQAETLLAALRELAGGAPWSPRAGSS